MTQQVYQVGGTLAKTATSYVERQADRDLFNGLREGQFCYVFNARQMGKSSLLVRTAHRLHQEHYCCALVDFSRIGTDHIIPRQWYTSVLIELARSLDGPPELLDRCFDFSPQETYIQQLNRFIDTVLLPYCGDRPIVILLDEIDSLLHLPFAVDDFFAWVRSCYNQRALKHSYQQVTFALFGVTTPRDLIRDPYRTPFNIGIRIDLRGLQRSEATPLLSGLRQLKIVPWSAETLLDEVLYWTGGQPFLTQKLCRLISQQSHLLQADTAKAWVAKLVQLNFINNWQTQDVPEHFRTIRDRILADQHQTGRLLGLYRRILQEPVALDNSHEQTALILAGLAAPEQGQLQVKNPIYRLIFSPAWIEDELYRLRPYASNYSRWAASNHRDVRHLLKGLELQQALTWARNKQLSDEDHRFLSASQAYAQQAAEQSLKLEQQSREALQHSLQMADLAHTKLNQARQKARQRPLPNPALWLTGIGLAVTGIVTVLQLSGFLQFSEWLALDVFFQQHIESATQQPITIIEITEADLRQADRFPLSDAMLSEAIHRIQQAQPALIGLDLYRDIAVEPGTEALQQTLSNNDNIVGIYKHVEPAVAPPPILPSEQIGFADQIVDSDGKVRRALLSVRSEDTVHYSFSLQLALSYLSQRSIIPQAHSQHMQLGKAQLYAFQSNDGGYVQADSGGYQVLLNYHGPRSQFSIFSLEDLLSQKIPEHSIANRIVIVGYTAESANDFFHTPYSTVLFQSPSRMPGVLLQANILAMLLSSALEGRTLLKVWPSLIEQGWIVAWIGLGALLSWQLRSLWQVAIAIIIGIGVLTTISFLSFIAGWWIPLVPAGLGFTISALLLPSLSDQVLFRHRLRQTVVYLYQSTEHQPSLFALGLTFLKQAEGRKHSVLIHNAARQYMSPPQTQRSANGTS